MHGWMYGLRCVDSYGPTCIQCRCPSLTVYAPASPVASYPVANATPVETPDRTADPSALLASC